jgi:hypothetical protein
VSRAGPGRDADQHPAHSGLHITYTTKVANPSGNRLATPDIVLAPTLRQVLAGADPVLGRALSYPR